MRGSRRLPSASLALAGAFVVLTGLVLTRMTLGLDARVQPWFTHQASSGAGARVLGVLAALGEMAVAAVVLLAAVGGACRRARSLRPALAALAAAAGTAVTVGVLKVAIGRTAPGAQADDVLAGGRSYPSGHAATAAVCLLLVAFLLTTRSGGRRSRALVLVAAVLAAAVAWATVALGFHWVSDVGGGLLVGAAWATGVRPWLTPDTVGAAQRPGR